MNRTTLAIVAAVVLAGGALVAVNVALTPPKNPDGPPEGFVVPGAAKPPPDTPAAGDPTRNPALAKFANAEAGKPFPTYGPPRKPTAEEEKAIGETFARSPGTTLDSRRHVAERARLWRGLRQEEAIPDSKPAIWDSVFRDDMGRLAESGAGWGNGTVIRVLPSADGKEVVAVVRYEGGAGPAAAQWWLVKGETGWMVFDHAAGPHWLRSAAVRADAEAEPIEGSETGMLHRLVTTARAPDAVPARTRDNPLPPTLAAWRAYAEGVLRLRQGQANDAIPFLDAAVKADPVFPLPRLARAEAYVALGRVADAKADCDAAEELAGSGFAAEVRTAAEAAGKK